VKLNSIRKNGGGREGSTSRWGDKDELKLSGMRKNDGLMPEMKKQPERRESNEGGRGKTKSDKNELKISEMKSRSNTVVASNTTNELEVRESREVNMWRAREINDMREEMKNMIKENKKEMISMIEDNNKVVEAKINDNKTEILDQMKVDKVEFKTAFEQMMEIMNGLKKNLL
jgi:hypothetical protein